MEENEELWNSRHLLIRQYENDVIKKIFPNSGFAETYMFGSPHVAPTSFRAKLLSEQLFKGTDYEYKGDNNFIHFTTIAGLKGILNSGWFRMSDFSNLIDQNELVYAARVFENSNLFNFNIEQIKSIKKNLFCFSACESNEETQKDTFMWEVYADKGRGVSIEFSFSEAVMYNHVLGRVRYGLSSLEPLKNINSFTEQFCAQNKDFKPNNLFEFLAEIKSFHKAKRFSNEKEVRLFFRGDNGLYINDGHTLIYNDINSKQEVKSFSKLFLKEKYPYTSDDNVTKGTAIEIFKHYPQVKIKKVTLGFNLSIEENCEIMEHINEIKNDGNYDFEIWQITEEEEVRKMI